jgi:hypothetical protein
MGKKLTRACLTLIALAAFALPATALGSPVITHPTGTVVAAGSKFTATNIGELIFKSGSTILFRCNTARMTGTLGKNSANHIEGTIETFTATGTGAEVGGERECTTSFGNTNMDTNIGNGTPWCLTAGGELAADEFTIRGNACNLVSRSITFVLTSTTAGACRYNRTGAIKGTFTTDTTSGEDLGKDAILTLLAGANTEFAKEEGGFLCPSTGSLEMQFTLETDTSPASPIYIS